MKNHKMLALVLVTLASIIWGVSFVSKEILLEDIHPGSLMSFQFLCVCVILGVYNFLIKKKFTINKSDFIGLFGTGIIGMNLYNIFGNMGIKETNSSIVSVLLAIIPIVCLLVDWIVYKRKFTKLKLLCILVFFAGVYMVIGSGGMAMTGSIKGYVYIVISVLSWVTFCFISDKYYSKYDAVEILMVQGFGALATSFFYLILYPIQISSINTEMFFHLFMIIIMNACLSFIFYIVAIRELGVTVTNVFNNMVPVVTLFVNIVFFNVEIGLVSILGTGVIIASVVVLNVFDRSCEECDMNVNVETKYVDHVN